MVGELVRGGVGTVGDCRVEDGVDGAGLVGSDWNGGQSEIVECVG